MTTIIPVILSGGAGTRLWPLSRASRPKQTLALVDRLTMIQATAGRVADPTRFAAPIVVCGAGQRELIERQLAEAGHPWACAIVEPDGRNTAPAIALAAQAALESGGEEALILVMPSDQVVADTEAFNAVVARASASAASGWLVTFGIEPSRPETGYGYIEAGDELQPGVFQATRFVEKPDHATAQAYVASGHFSWNAGMFLMRAASYLAELEASAADIAHAARAAWDMRRTSAGAIEPGRAAFLASPSQSIDYAVMEKSRRVAVAPVSMGWSDIGSFKSLFDELPGDTAGNRVAGDAVIIDSRDCLVRSTGPLVATIGVSDLVIVATPDGVLVAAKDRTQDVKAVVDQLKAMGKSDLL